MAQPLVTIDTPLGDDASFLSLRATAELGRMFSYELTLVSKRPDIDFGRILGKRVTVSLHVPKSKDRLFGGHVVAFRQTGMRGRLFVYEAAVRPWLWLLTRRSNCRIFQNKTVEDIVKAVFADPVYKSLELGDIKWKATSRTHAAREYCVQYRESDFNFVSRLLEDDGIYYWYQDRDGRESLVLTDTLATHEPVAEHESLPYGAVLSGAPGAEYISEWRTHHEIETRNWLLTDYDFKNPSRQLQKKAVKTMPGFDAFSELEHFDFPGGYVDPDYGASRAKSRADELRVDATSAAWSEESTVNWHQVDARTNGMSVRIGSLLKLERHPRSDQNAQYLVTRTRYEIDLADYEAFEGSQPSRCECWFSAINAKQPFAAARTTRKPFVQGPQTAAVVGPAGDEIYTDTYGRVKVQFFWDRLGKRDENSSCWMRVSQPWAGKGWGAVAIPRIGQEVIVDFLEGDPDRPIITGRVYNAEQLPPYELPANMTQSGVKSRSSKGGSGANCNEFRFEDKKGQEQVLLHAEKNQDIEVEHDETHWVGHDRTKTIGNNETTHVTQDRTETVGRNEKITIGANRTETVIENEGITIGVNRTESVGVNEVITIGANRTILVKATETATVLLQRTHTVGINETIAIGAAQEIGVGAFQAVAIGAYQTVNVGASQTVSVGTNQTTTVGESHKLTVGAGQTVSITSDASQTIGGAKSSKVAKGRITSVGEGDALKVGKSLIIDAGEAITLTTGSASISMKKDGTITISGKNITLDASGKIAVSGGSEIVMRAQEISQN